MVHPGTTPQAASGVRVIRLYGDDSNLERAGKIVDALPLHMRREIRPGFVLAVFEMLEKYASLDASDAADRQPDPREDA